MINIKRLFLVCLTFLLFLNVTNTNAQSLNQFDENKKRTGAWKKYHPNKRVRYVGQFKDGKEVGTFKFYSMISSQFPEAIKKFYQDSDSVSVKYFYLNGTLKGEGMLLGRKKVGKWVYYYKKKTVFSEEFYQDGKLSGNTKIYFKTNGKLAEDSEYKDGVLNGVSKVYADTGVLIEEVVYKNGKRVGKWEFYIEGEVVDQKKKNAAREKYKKRN